MQILALCGRKSSSFSVNPRQEVAQRKSNDLSAAQASERFEFSQNLQIGTGESNGSCLSNGLHIPNNLQGGLPLVDVPEQSKVHKNYICNTNDIQGQPEISASGTAHRLSSSVRDSVISSTLPPLDWLLDPEKSKSLSDRVLARLIQAEAHERETQYQTSLRLAWQIVYHAAKGDAVECSPTTLAYYSVVGCHEEDYYPKLMIRRAAAFGDANRISISARKQRGKPSQARADSATPPSKKSARVPQINKKGATA